MLTSPGPHVIDAWQGTPIGISEGPGTKVRQVPDYNGSNRCIRVRIRTIHVRMRHDATKVRHIIPVTTM